MANSVVNKLKIKEGSTLLVINPPPDFKEKMSPLPPGVKISTATKNYSQIHWFVLSKSQMEKELKDVLKLVTEGVIIWIYYPKGSSKIQTDLTRDRGWEMLLNHNEFQWLSLISFDDTWSAFAMRLKSKSEVKKEPAKERPIFKYIDAEKKMVKVPDDLATEMKKNKKVANFFDKLSFTNRKEYVEWVVTAKREETRNERVKGTIVRLGKGWKNPRNI